MDNRFRDFILKWGLMFGLAQCLASLVAYLLGTEWMVGFTFGTVNLAIWVGGPVYCGIMWKKMEGGYLDFKKSFLVIFLVFAAAGFVSLGYSVLMYSVIDPEIPGQIREAALGKTFALMERFGTPEDVIEKTMEELEKADMDYSPSSLVKNYFSSWLWGAILALIGAAIIKKNKPLFDEASDM